jgi:Carboxypeptidase regulatory-like domain
MNLRAILTACAVVVALSGAPASAQSLSLIGSIRGGNGPISGASVYVQQVSDLRGAPVNGQQVGPVASDSNGVFAFYNLAPGRYTVKITIAGKLFWQGNVIAPGKLTPIVLH